MVGGAVVKSELNFCTASTTELIQFVSVTDRLSIIAFNFIDDVRDVRDVQWTYVDGTLPRNYYVNRCVIVARGDVCFRKTNNGHGRFRWNDRVALNRRKLRNKTLPITLRFVANTVNGEIRERGGKKRCNYIRVGGAPVEKVVRYFRLFGRPTASSVFVDDDRRQRTTDGPDLARIQTYISTTEDDSGEQGRSNELGGSKQIYYWDSNILSLLEYFTKNWWKRHDGRSINDTIAINISIFHTKSSELKTKNIAFGKKCS